MYFPIIQESIFSKKGHKPKFLSCNEFLDHADEVMKHHHFSPDAIVGHARELELYTDAERVCTRTLYNYIDANILKTKNIDLAQKMSRKPRNKRSRTNKKVLGKSIDERPTTVEERTSFGHLEIDCVLLKKTKERVLLTLVERLSRQIIVRILEIKTAACVNQALSKIQSAYGDGFTHIFKSITSDNGSEFADLTACLENKGTEVYYAHPCSSWERGTNERTNGMIRWFIPKKMDPSRVTPSLVKRIENWLNHYPRKILGYATPFDVFCEYTNEIFSQQVRAS